MNFLDKQYIFKYDEDDHLFEYVEKDDTGQLKCAYNYQNNTLKKVYKNYDDGDQVYSDFRSTSTYPDGCTLLHHTIDGASWVVVRKPNGDYVSPIKKIENQDGNYSGYSVKKELINKWTKK